MTQLLSLLSIYYYCDAAIANNLATRGQIAECMAIYEQVKQEFAEDGDTNSDRYLAFKAWEVENSGTVDDLKGIALDVLREQHKLVPVS